MKCSLCGFEFDPVDARSSCAGCLTAKHCELIRCPKCGFEMAEEPKWVKKIKNWRKKNERINR